jgi:ATP-dependent RNA helicase DDX27
VLNDIQCELEHEREMKEAEREMLRTENMLKYKTDIDSRPRKEWFQSYKRKETVKKEAKENLKELKRNFEDNVGKSTNIYRKKKREQKADTKESAKVEKSGSKFSSDRETDNKKLRYKNQKLNEDKTKAEKHKYFKKKSTMTGKRKSK